MSSRLTRALFLAALLFPQIALAQSAPSAPSSDLDEIIVTLSGHERRRFDVIQGSTVLEGDALRREVAATLGDTLESQTGVTTTGFAPGSSRPVIRGQGGPRLRVLQNGLASIDVSANSPDHQVAAPPLLAERIEVLRGAGALRYGSNAIGGVVNVIDGRIAERLPDAPLVGALDLHAGSNAEVRRGAFALRASDEQHVLYLNMFGRRSHDIEINGRALSATGLAEADGDDPLYTAEGRVPDTHADTDGGTLGVSRIFERGHFGVSYSLLNSNYGLPAAHGHEDEHGHAETDADEMHAGEDEAAHEEVLSLFSDLEQHRVDIAAGYRPRAGFVEELKVRAGYADYAHEEIEAGHEGEQNVGTRFENSGFNLRAEFVQRARGGLDGSFGFEYRDEERIATGEEAFLPKHETRALAAYLSEEWHRGRLTLEGGARFEYSTRAAAGEHPVCAAEPELCAPPTARPALRRRNFNTWSASLGAAFAPVPDATLGLALLRTERPPTAEELYAFGTHFGTGGFEIGADTLEAETAWSVEFSAKRRRGRASGVLNLYATRFDDFIFPRDTGEEVEGLIERRYTQADADFRGAELDLHLLLAEFAGGRAQLDLGFDLVRAALARADANGSRHLPRIAPRSVQLGLALEFSRARLSLEARYIGGQRRTAEGETPTAGYFVVNAEAALHFDAPARGRAVTLFLQARNLGDEGGRNHVSFLKERLPIAGRDLRLGLRWHF